MTFTYNTQEAGCHRLLQLYHIFLRWRLQEGSPGPLAQARAPGAEAWRAGGRRPAGFCLRPAHLAEEAGPKASGSSSRFALLRFWETRTLLCLQR